jgi:predicted nucleic acid-binding protein
MKIVVDTNILFSFFWRDSVTRKLLLTSNFELVSPKIALEEIKKYSKEIIKKAKITQIDFNSKLLNLKKIISFVDKSQYSSFLKEAEKIAPDKADADFLALCFRFSCFLWSNDSILKRQNKIRVLSTKEIIEILF